MKQDKKKKRKRKRRKRKSKGKTVTLTILHSNPRGWVSKQESIVKLLKFIKPDYVNLNETQLQGNNKVNIKGYTTYCKNRAETAGGGICSAIANGLKQSAVLVGEGGAGDEWLAVRLTHVSPPITILNCYGEQEARSGKEEVLARWGRLLHSCHISKRGKTQEIRGQKRGIFHQIKGQKRGKNKGQPEVFDVQGGLFFSPPTPLI